MQIKRRPAHDIMQSSKIIPISEDVQIMHTISQATYFSSNISDPNSIEACKILIEVKILYFLFCSDYSDCRADTCNCSEKYAAPHEP